MAQIGLDCEVILDGNGYFIKPETYTVKQPRVRKATVRANGSLAYVDLGPGKRLWSMVILARNELLKYDGTLTGITGQQYRDALRTSYSSNIGTTINFTDPLNSTAIAVHFESYEEKIIDLHSQIIAVATGGTLSGSYEIAISLLEA